MISAWGVDDGDVSKANPGPALKHAKKVGSFFTNAHGAKRVAGKYPQMNPRLRAQLLPRIGEAKR